MENLSQEQAYSTVESLNEIYAIPFSIKRVYWISNVPEGTIRGTHAHRNCEELIEVTRGRVEVKLVDLKGQIWIKTLSIGNFIYVPIFVWKAITFYEDAQLLVYASNEYCVEDYIYEEEFFEQ